jgi:anaphase-promoting complex subunit 2
MVTSRNRRFGDVTSMLITIYGSKEKFVDEYHVLLAENLLELTDFNIENQQEQLELLKLRFGEDPMQSCDVMLKDFKDSKRIATGIADNQLEADAAAAAASGLDHVFVLSSKFWPAVALRGEDTLEVPASMKAAFAQYNTKYAGFKPNRLLEYKLVRISSCSNVRTFLRRGGPPVQSLQDCMCQKRC